MRPTLHIIANCTDRKKATVPDELRLRSVSEKDIEHRAQTWWRRLSRYRGQAIPAMDLYSGGHWAVIRTLPDFARQAGFSAKLWVISAGYGLVPSSACLHPYSATFSGTHPDAVITSAINNQSRKDLLQTWWSILSAHPGPDITAARSITNLVRKSRDSYFLIVASPDYLSALGQDLLTAAKLIADVSRLIIISSCSGVTNERLSKNVIPSDARLQARVGGARGSLHARIASLIINNSPSWGLNAESLRNRFDNLIKRSPQLKRYERERLSDDRLREFIRDGLNQTPQPSCSSLLRSLRDSERACEQSRFKELYWQVREEAQ